ncbi:MAG: MBL fold metallo-hydrolase [Proteobacteria bacterium]|nr:MBL fold metallo-hydrolase [Pseudomonadota bacterium]MBU1739832.1 MBL fold metallo-hydrolase [Pseudomonadota bacterium]
MLIKQIVVGSFRVNCYLVACPKTKNCVIIDPGGDADLILQSVREDGLHPLFILNTHGHADHVVANRQLSAAFSIPVCMHEDDDIFFADPAVRLVSEKELGLVPPGPADIRLKDGEVLEVGSLRIRVIHTPGHTPGSVCYLVAGNLFTGDTLFVGDVGRTDLSGGSFDKLLASIKDKILPLPDTTKVLPGHDYGEAPTSTLAWEKEENPYITDFILAAE